ncbi:hypothetical protein GCM10010400_38450 [Streptomyces aculeolatus]|uniref:hypothetical protein n=1 Tax=Streptomyces aculeolatus TaxID=270689 RepID=UPI001CED4D6E|nr:hypothetical protein [Streptomyces aculeolatus]
MASNVDAGTPPYDSADRKLTAFVRLGAEVAGVVGRSGWAHPTQFHLLLTHGRLFTYERRPAEVRKLPDRECYDNAARTARAHRDRGLIYAEGFATTHGFPLPHAWCVDPDGGVVDPTWDQPDPTTAYLGVALADAQLWPREGEAVLGDPSRFLPLLREGLPMSARSDAGRPLISASTNELV